MRVRSVVSAGAVLLVTLFAAFGQEVAEYQPLMKAAASANGMLQKSVQSDLATAATHAAEVRSAFQKIEQFWAKYKVADAQEFARNAQKAAGEAEAAAKAGNQEQAIAAAKQIGANCQGCHQAHREKGADGSFMIK